MKTRIQLMRQTAQRTLAVLAISAAASVSAQDAAITLLAPAPGATGVYPKPLVRVELTDGVTTVNTNTIVMTFNGAPVSPSITQAAGVTYVAYLVPAPLPALTNCTVTFTAQDNTPTVISTNWSFTTGTITTVPASWAYAAGSGDVAQPGFAGRVHQLRADATIGASIAIAENQMNGTLIEPATTLPYTNMVVDSSSIPGGWSGTTPADVGGSPAEARPFTNANTINYSIDSLLLGVADMGNFTSTNGYPDALWPGLPGSFDYTFLNYFNAVELAFEVTCWLELPAGLHGFGVNNPHAVQVAVGPNDPRDFFRTSLILAEGQQDTPVQRTAAVLIETNGVYAFRVIFRGYRDIGNFGLEFFSFDPVTGNPVLVNDAVVGAVKAYRALTVPTRPYVRSYSPADGASGVAALNPVSVVLANATNSPAPILKVKGNTVSYTSVTNGSDITITHTPAAPLSGSVNCEVNYAGAVGQWTYLVASGRKCMFVLPNAGSPNTADSFVAARLASVFGFDVEFVGQSALNGDAATMSLTTNKQLVVISSTVSSSAQVAWSQSYMTNNITVPLINWEAFNNDEWGFGVQINGGGTTLDIINAPNELTGGLTNGNYVVQTAASGANGLGSPVPGLIIAAHQTGDPTSIRIAGMPVGLVTTIPVGGTVTNASRKVWLGLLGNDNAPFLNANGLALFDAAVEWAAPTPPAQPVLTVTGGPGAGQVTLSWTSTGTLETTTNLAAPAWINAPSQANPQTVNSTDPQRYYRVKQ